MLCPICDSDTRITDSRPDCESVRRGRECRNCGYRFTTIEIDKDLYERTIKEKEANRNVQSSRQNGI